MRRETGVTHDLHCSNITLKTRGVQGRGAGRGLSQATLLILLSSFPFKEMISGNSALPRLSLKIIFNTIDDIHRGQASLTLPRKDDLRGQRKEHREITSKSQRLAYVKPETIGKSVEEDRGAGGLAGVCICQRRFCHRLCFPHKKKINSADYQVSIKCLLWPQYPDGSGRCAPPAGQTLHCLKPDITSSND